MELKTQIFNTHFHHKSASLRLLINRKNQIIYCENSGGGL